MLSPDRVLKFWLDDLSPADWYNATDALDAQIRDEFLPTLQAAKDGKCGFWLTYPSGALAYIILTDQFPRNIYRGQAAAFATDHMALAVAKAAIHAGWDMKIDEPARQFFYLPLMHSESLTDQERCVRLMKERMPQTGAQNLLHARVHREVIREFGRFPYRNSALSRSSSSQEADFVAQGGYQKILGSLGANA